MPTYQRFSDPAAATELADRLRSGGIAAVIKGNNGSAGSPFVQSEMMQQFHVCIKQNDFVAADALLMKDAENELDGIAEDHYLYSFTEEELMAILERPDEWSALDRRLAQKILKERGAKVSGTEIAEMRTHRAEELSRPEDAKTIWIIIGYAFACLGGVIGIIIGGSLAISKKTLPNGEQIFAWSEEDRMHGRIMVYIGSALVLLAVANHFR